MCGIAGIISGKRVAALRGQVTSMTGCLQHRGPDARQVWVNAAATVGLGHSRLAIIDLRPEAGQPMHLKDRYTVVFNGELYNYIELRAQLVQRGYVFATASDTEVLVAGYDYWGSGCLQHFEGMFAFAIWDEQAGRLFAARDRFGEKPFYYSYSNGELCFASEIKSLLAAGTDRTVNDNRVLQFLCTGTTYQPAQPEQTFYRHIRQLPPGHCLVFDLQQQALHTIAYYQLQPATHAGHNFTELFSHSVQQRLRSDVPVGTSLSGGLDSSAIAALMHQEQPAAQYAFTATFAGFEKDEWPYAEQVARHLQLRHVAVPVTAADFVAGADRFFAAHDEPVTSASGFAQYKVYEAARQHGIKVLLDGQGADETLAGYTRYLHWYLQECFRQSPARCRAERQLLAAHYSFRWGPFNYLAAFVPGLIRGLLERRTARQQQHNNFLQRDFTAAAFDRCAIQKPLVQTLNDVLLFDTTRGPLQELLRFADTNSMAHGVEVRLPFLDHRLVEYALALPAAQKIQAGYTKHVLRTAMNPYLPAAVTWRKDKVGFEPPQRQWMQHPQLHEMIQAARELLVQRGVLDPRVLAQPVQPEAAHAAGNRDWRILSLVKTVFKE